MKKLWLAGLVAVLAVAGLVLLHVTAPEPIVVQLEPGPPQPKVPPGEAGIDPAALDAAVTYAAARNTSALLIGRGGHIVFEKYWDETTLDSPVELSGFAPVLVALAVGSAMNDRLIVNLDAPLSNYIKEDEGVPAGAGTLRELLSQDGAVPDPAESVDAVALALERLTAQPWQRIVAERLWTPLGGGELAFLQRGGKRRPDGASAACCLRVRLGDWMRVGEALANDGVFEGNQLTPPRYVSLMLAPTHKGSAHGFFTRVDGTFATHDVARLEAAGKQRLWIVPSLRLVILRVGGEPPASHGWDEAMIPDSIIRGTSGWQPKSVGEGVDPKLYAPH